MATATKNHTQSADEQFAQHLEFELALRELECCAAHQRLPRLRRCLQAGRCVHGISGYCIGRPRRRSEIAGDDSTGIDTDVER